MTASQSSPSHPNPWELVQQAQRAAIRRGEARLAEILSMVLQHRQGLLEQDQRVSGTFVVLPRSFFYELERFLAEQAAQAELELKKGLKDGELLPWWYSEPEVIRIYGDLVRHGRNSGVY